jgi:hypothetical protein
MGAAQDWETAANFLHRASKIPDEIVAGDFAAEMVASAETPDPPKVTLEMAAEGLCKLFLARFEKAVNEKDGEGITRFFKLFPLIGRGDTGLDVYGRYVCTGVAGRAREVMNQDQKGDFFFAGAVTGLFEHIATIVEQHGKLVELHYGEGKMVKVVERLQVEADMQAGIIIDTFSDEKALERKVYSALRGEITQLTSCKTAHRYQILCLRVLGAVLPCRNQASQNWIPCSCGRYRGGNHRYQNRRLTLK